MRSATLCHCNAWGPVVRRCLIHLASRLREYTRSSINFESACLIKQRSKTSSVITGAKEKSRHRIGCSSLSRNTMGFSLSVSKDLLDQIREENGMASSSSRQEASHAASPTVTRLARDVDHRALLAFMKSSKQAASALYSSREIGGLLVKHEEAEIAKAQRHAADVLSAYRAQGGNQPPCLKQREACLTCYKNFPGDELQCASAVQAYDECVKRCLQRPHSNS